MEKIKLETLKDSLLEQQHEILSNVGTSSDDLNQLQGDHPADWIDRATVDNAVNNLLTLESDLANGLAVIKRALQKIEEGTYGICEDCGEEIAYERLEVLPMALYCRKCQDQEEKRRVNGSSYRRRTSIPKDILEWFQ